MDGARDLRCGTRLFARFFILHAAGETGYFRFVDHVRTRVGIEITIDRAVSRQLVHISPFPRAVSEEEVGG